MKLFLLIFSLILSQTWQPFHLNELLKYQSIVVDYETIDRTINDTTETVRTNLTHKVIGYLPYWEYDSYPYLDYTLLSEINYFSAELNEFGNIINDHNWENINFIDYAQSYGVKVKLCATLFNSNSLESLLSNSSYRTNAINNLLNKVLSRNADGVDINFEQVPSNQRENLVIFMQELSNTFHENMEDPIISMATPAIDWSNAWDYNALAEICDGLFIMGYNYFFSGSENAGPVSPLGGYFYDLDYTIQDYIYKTGNQSEKLILGLPYYGYDWPVSSSLINSTTTGLGSPRTYSSCESLLNNYSSIWNTLSNSFWIPYLDNSWQQVWYDDSLSLSIKYNYAKNMNLGGVGIWALGYDNNSPEMWGSIYDQFNINLNGDLNNDLILNIFDIIIMISLITENAEYNQYADLNDDVTVNIQDIIILVNLILDS